VSSIQSLDKLNDKIDQLTRHYEKRIFDLEQLIEISKSLNSSLEFNTLIQSVLYVCMGQLRVLRAGIFVRKDLNRQHLILHRNQVGFEIDHDVSYVIPEDHPLLRYLEEHFTCHTFTDLKTALPELTNFLPLAVLDPVLIIPLRSKNLVNGIIILGDPISAEDFSQEEKDYAMTIATISGVAVYNSWLYEVTTTDMMTKLRLKHFFIDQLSATMAESRRGLQKLQVIMIDIDNFKSLNDSYGHLAGDKVLIEVAEIILNTIRGSDVAARYGGEEFVILLRDCTQEVGLKIAERIRSQVENEDYLYNDQKLKVTISLGITSYVESIDRTPQHLLERADKALYMSKQKGKNQVTLLVS
jgi:two-component system cell cycle response regulator